MVKSEIVSIINNLPLIALAVSGGSDSMAMAEWFRQNRPLESFVILNIDHHIRGEESRADSEFVENYAKQHGIKYYHYDVDAVGFSRQNGYTLEQAARILRHQIFEQACVEYAYAVATAHHQGDQAESVFMHIARGSGLDGLVGMSCFDGHIIRPLIDTSKQEIMQFIAKNNVQYREDSTNADNDFSRNYIRQVVFPIICQKYENFPQNLIKLSNRAREYADFIDQHTPALVMQDNSVQCDLKGKHLVVQAEMLRRAFSLLGVTADVEERHIKLLLSFAQKQGGGSLDMPYDTIAYNEKGALVLAKKSDYPMVEYPFAEGVFELGGFEVIVQKVDYNCFLNKAESAVEQNAFNELYLSLDDPCKVVLRLRKNGDKIAKFGGGSKSLGDFLTDKKVPLRLKERLPIVAQENNVLCACGVDISSTVKVQSTSRNIYKITIN